MNHQQRTSSGDPATHGFTLIELLVVISIIAVLAGMLLPAISSVRTSARASVCGSQFRQLGAGVFQYTNDWDGILPPSRFQACAPADLGYPPGITAAWTDPPWVGDYLDGPQMAGGSFGTKPLSGPWRCPEDRTRRPVAGLKEVSYGLNMTLCPYADNAAQASTINSTLRPLSWLRATSALLLGAETQEARWFWAKISPAGWPAISWHDQETTTPQWALGQPAPNHTYWRHKQKANFLFADGHVQLRGDPNADVAARVIFVRPSDVP